MQRYFVKLKKYFYYFQFQDIQSDSNQFQVNQKLEAIDPRNPSHYCVCTVIEVKGYRIRLNFDGFQYGYDFWRNANSPFIFPAGWTEKNGRYLDPPRSKCALLLN